MQQRQRPRREPSLQYERGECDAAEGGDGKNDQTIAKHCNSPTATKGLAALDVSIAWRFPRAKAFLMSGGRRVAYDVGAAMKFAVVHSFLSGPSSVEGCLLFRRCWQ